VYSIVISLCLQFIEKTFEVHFCHKAMLTYLEST